jgi:uncharacterized protein (DUF1778 family)
MAKTLMLNVRITRDERRALVRYAKLRKIGVSQLVRLQVIEAAMREDPRQKQLALANLGGQPV